MSFLELERRTDHLWLKPKWVDFWRRLGQGYYNSFTPVEIGLRGLAAETQQWPDEYVIYPHGRSDENPHVWFPLKITWRHSGDGSAIVVINDEICPCGQRHSSWIFEESLKLAKPIVIPVRQPMGGLPLAPPVGDVIYGENPVAAGEMQTFLAGLMSRDVQ